MVKRPVLIVAVVLVTLIAGQARSVPTQWSGNGHYYELVNESGGINWAGAKQAAENMTLMGSNEWHLATITSAGESYFITSLCTSGGADSYVLVGGYQDILALDYSEPAGGWRWITGEAWSYTNWHSSEPNDNIDIGENILLLKPPMYNYQWNDGSDGYAATWYLVENSSIPAPGAILLGSIGVSIVGYLRRRRAI